MKWFLIAIGGGLGSVLRYYLQGVVQIGSGSLFPFGTLVVNLGGSLCIGFLAGLAEAKLLSPVLTLFLMAGLLGGFTTFSTFSLENVYLVKMGQMRYAILNVLISNGFGIALAFAGYSIAAASLSPGK